MIPARPVAVDTCDTFPAMPAFSTAAAESPPADDGRGAGAGNIGHYAGDGKGPLRARVDFENAMGPFQIRSWHPATPRETSQCFGGRCPRLSIRPDLRGLHS